MQPVLQQPRVLSGTRSPTKTQERKGKVTQSLESLQMLQELEVPQPREVAVVETQPPRKPSSTELSSEIGKPSN